MPTPEAISQFSFSPAARAALLLCLEAGCGVCAHAEYDSLRRMLRGLSGVATSRGILES